MTRQGKRLALLIMPSLKERRESEEEREAREKGRAIPHYAKKVGKTLAKPPRSGKLTPSKRGGGS